MRGKATQRKAQVSFAIRALRRQETAALSTGHTIEADTRLTLVT